MTPETQGVRKRRMLPVMTLLLVVVAVVSFAIPRLQWQLAVAIPDPVLRAALHEVLNIPVNEPIRARHLAGVTYLDLSDKTHIRDLTGLERAPLLAELHLRLSPGAEPAGTQAVALRNRGVRVVMVE